MEAYTRNYGYYYHVAQYKLQQQPELWVLAPLALVGFLYVASHQFNFIRLLLSLFVLPGKSFRSFGPPGSWAVVTGASDGIGLEFATSLAKKKFNLLLISRTASKLDTLASSLQSKYNVETQTIAMDFAHAKESDYKTIASTIKDLDVAVLINNVGKSHDIPVPFAETELDELKDIININCMGTLRVTHLIVPGMISRKRGLILTMGSFGGLMPSPLLATYSGSKAFLQQWSTALGSELASKGITVELVQSYLVTSAMSKIKRASLTIPTPRAFVNAVFAKIGRTGGAQGFAYTSTPYWAHALMQYVVGATTGFASYFTVAQNNGFHVAIRKRALRKREREAGKKNL